MTDDRYVDLAGLVAYSSLSKAQLYRFIADPIHPLPVHHVGRRVLFLKSEFDRWLREHDRIVTQVREDSDTFQVARALRGWPRTRRRTA